MSERTKGLPTNRKQFIEVTVGIPGKEESIYKIPNTSDAKAQLKKFFQNFESNLTPWREVASDEIKKYTEAGMALRAARYREGLSQKALAKLCDISQDNLSRMETGKRAIGEILAKRLGRILNVDYRLFRSQKAKGRSKK